MKTKLERCRFVRIWLAVLWVTSFMVVTSSYAWAKDMSGSLPRGQAEKRLVTIDDRSPEYNYVFVGKIRYKVSSSAVILDGRGRKITLGDIFVPCKAYITYQIFGDTRDPMVHQIQLR